MLSTPCSYILGSLVPVHVGNDYQYTGHQSFSGDYDNHLKQINNDGQLSYSLYERVRFITNKARFTNIYPNTNRGYFSFGIQNPDRQPASILLLECAGLLVRDKRFPDSSMAKSEDWFF